MRSTRTRVLAASVAALATFAVAGCGGDDDDATETTEAVAGSGAPEGTEASEENDATVTAGTGGDTTAGSGSGEVGEREEYVEAAKEEIDLEDGDINDCVAEAIISDDVYAAIQDAGLSVDAFRENGPAGEVEIDEAQAQAVADDMASCGDLIPQIVTEDAERACAEDNLTNEQMAAFLSFTLFGLDPSEDLQAANTAVEECLSGSTTTTG